MWTSSGTVAALEYEEAAHFSHSSQSGGYYKAMLSAMIHRPNMVERIPKRMNNKGFDALCDFFEGNLVGLAKLSDLF